MGAIASLSTAGATLRRNPLIFVGGFAFALGTHVPTLLELVHPLASAGSSLLLFLLYPFFLGSLLGLADAGLEHTASLDDFWEAGTEHYLSLLGASVLFAVGFVVLAIVGGLVVLGVGAALGAAALGSGLDDVGLGVVSGVGVLVFALGLALFALYALLQFYDAAIVVAGDDAVGSFSTSAELVGEHPLSVVGYTLVFGAISASIALVERAFYAFDGAAFLAGPAFDATGGTSTILAVAAGLLLGTVAYAFVYTYHVAYFRWLRGDSTDDTAVAHRGLR